MVKDTSSQPHTRIRILAAIGVTVFLLAVAPRLLPEIALSRRVVLWVPVMHQILLAILSAFAIWIMAGKRRIVAVALTSIIVLIWGPNFAAAVEYSITGKNLTVLALADRAGVTPVLSSVYVFFSETLGYSLSVATSP